MKKRKRRKHYKIKGKKFVQTDFYLLAVFCVIFGFIFYEGVIFLKYKTENNRLVSLKKEYEALNIEIDKYKELKVQYEVVLNNEVDLISNKKSLEDRINLLSNDIQSLEKKINDINKKIINLS